MLDLVGLDSIDLSSLELSSLKIGVVGATPSACWPAKFIAAAIMLGTDMTPSLDVLEESAQKYGLPYERRASSIGDWIQMGDDWIVTCRPGSWSVWSREAFGFLPLPPAAAARLAA